MKILSYAAFFLCFSLLTMSMNDNSRMLPNVEVKTLDGKTVKIQDYHKPGNLTILSFWATWCHPCMRELDAISELYPEWQDKYNVQLVAVTIDNARALAKVKPLVLQKGWDYTILSDAKQELQKALNFQVIPQTFLVIKDGRIVYDHSGYTPGDEYQLEDQLKALAGS